MAKTKITPLELLGTKEAAEYLGVRPRYLRLLVTNEKVRATKIGTFYLFQVSDLNEFKNNRPKLGRPFKRKQ